ncbi:NAD-dependent epimerase/dehydratase family protein [Sinomonas humi]|uniref:NAD-dependent epimerase n=1 Tax=Sinomonas humi TaxID=1338436 RepID=A0A0B2AC89_9MICC|nr:NAD-dependent epimerase/dehydratase family protein [Sinomonas humi]KHL01225.1 NAD-dependent epimerase [Sinomonas humi]
MTVLAGARVLVTGGAGTVGSTIVDRLLDAGVEHVDVLDNLSSGRLANLGHALATGRVRLVEGDLRDRDAVHDATVGKDLVFHEAAIRVAQCPEEPRLALDVLVDGTFTVLEAASQHGVDKVVLASNASVYGNPDELPMAERQCPNTRTLYGAAKCFAEGLARSFRAMYGLDYVALRYFDVYGPRMDVYGLYTEVLVRWMERIADGRPPLVYGNGEQTMDFVYTTDVARANIYAAEAPVYEGVYNVGSGIETSLLALAVALLDAMNSDLSVEFGPEREPDGVTRRLADTRAAARDLGFWAEVPLDEGLRRLVAWWCPLREEIAAARVVAAS